MKRANRLRGWRVLSRLSARDVCLVSLVQLFESASPLTCPPKTRILAQPEADARGRGSARLRLRAGRTNPLHPLLVVSALMSQGEQLSGDADKTTERSLRREQVKSGLTI